METPEDRPDTDTTTETEIKRYTKLYEVNRIGWHKNEVNPILERCIHHLENNKNGSKKIFIPLCGKTKDIPYLLSLGWRVFGVEAVQKAIEGLDTENSLGLVFNEQESTYSKENKELVIFYGDILKCPIEKWGPFDAVWDRGSFSVMTFDQRPNYIEKVQAGLRTITTGEYVDFNYLLAAYDYDKALNDSPPRSCSTEDMRSNFESWAQVEKLEVSQAPQSFLTHFKTLAGKDCRQIVYLITKCNNCK